MFVCVCVCVCVCMFVNVFLFKLFSFLNYCSMKLNETGVSIILYTLLQDWRKSITWKIVGLVLGISCGNFYHFSHPCCNVLEGGISVKYV